MGFLLLLSLAGLGAALTAFLPEDDQTDDNVAPPPDDTRPAIPEEGETLLGTAGDDSLGAGETQTLRGLAGDDSLVGNGEAVIYGDTGRDRIELSGDGAVYGGFGNDSITGFGENMLYGGAGDDWVSGQESRLVDGGTGDDFLVWKGSATTPSGHDATLRGGEGDDSIVADPQQDGLIIADGGSGNDFVSVGQTGIARGASGDDTLSGSTGAQLFGGEGADMFTNSTYTFFNNGLPIEVGDFTKGTDRIEISLPSAPEALTLRDIGPDSVLTVKWASDGPPLYDLKVIVRGVTGLSLSDFDFVYETQQDPFDTVRSGTSGTDRITLPAQRALVMSGAGDDTVLGTADSDFSLVSLGAGDDLFRATGAQGEITGGAGNDGFDYTIGTATNASASASIRFDGGQGDDTVLIRAGAAGTPVPTGIDINLGSGNDIVTVDRNAEARVIVFEDDGDDRIGLWMGHQAIMYGSGNDSVTIGITADHLANRNAASVLALSSGDRVQIDIDSAIQGEVIFVQFPSGDGDVTELQIDGQAIVKFDALIAANDPRLIINRGATFT